ncbi:3-isopropylmalate dehydratase large subunit [hydrothermal vent metagenome]|uniref:3-isopropylmalate dehydratase n=1 Tax=hydrothermal vent metagenome TaxID=652676 RepID=A0A3B0SVJ9_9ZZZZ
MPPMTLFEKLWDCHVVSRLGQDAALIYIDRIFLHERTGSIALKGLEEKQRPIRHPENIFCTIDHIVDTLPGRGDDTLMPGGRDFIRTTRKSAMAAGITLFDIDDGRQGIIHVISPELGIVLPGLSLICPDSHTCTQGAFGALAFGVGSTEAEQAMATSVLRVERPKTMRVSFNGPLAPDVTAKDMILHLIGEYTAAGGNGHVVEFSGDVVAGLDMEGRMTLCNMAVEFGAFTGIIAPDQKTFDYLAGRDFAPKGEDWHNALKDWRKLKSDDGASFDREITITASDIRPMVTWGTSPGQVMAMGGVVPDPAEITDQHQRAAAEKALSYMAVEPGSRITDLSIDGAFIGSCTNSRLSDLRKAARILKGRQVAPGVRAICVPGSSRVKRQAEDEGLDQIFRAAGFEWRESGCSMCFYAGGESFGFQQRVVTSTNRNFESRQGPKVRSHLASPEIVAASAIMGRIASPQEITEQGIAEEDGYDRL